nr:MAG TPA: hypothetical protein [Caudoviricetes sp.]
MRYAIQETATALYRQACLTPYGASNHYACFDINAFKTCLF